jgi:hypothetical protein
MGNEAGARSSRSLKNAAGQLSGRIGVMTNFDFAENRLH